MIHSVWKVQKSQKNPSKYKSEGFQHVSLDSRLIKKKKHWWQFWFLQTESKLMIASESNTLPTCSPELNLNNRELYSEFQGQMWGRLEAAPPLHWILTCINKQQTPPTPVQSIKLFLTSHLMDSLNGTAKKSKCVYLWQLYRDLHLYVDELGYVSLFNFIPHQITQNILSLTFLCRLLSFVFLCIFIYFWLLEKRSIPTVCIK